MFESIKRATGILGGNKSALIPMLKNVHDTLEGTALLKAKKS
jgi:hypothetical protein